jgi:hypothetical protein
MPRPPGVRRSIDDHELKILMPSELKYLSWADSFGARRRNTTTAHNGRLFTPTIVWRGRNAVNGEEWL